MAKSHTRKKSVKSKPALSPVKLQVIGQATDKIKKWTRHEISRLQHDQQTAICVPVKDGYRVGLYALRVYNNKTCDVRDYNNSLRKHLLKVEAFMGKPMSFGMISNTSVDFNQVWMNYLSFVALNSEGESGLMPNTIGKQNKNLKALFNWCFDKNIISKLNRYS